eukprot:gnl/TRDRNA2_/TRDRNA2_158120_c0_seq1.p1 gnl/TRDRNA2_/TRDRNA2_158120_c0~~gnl/TRDRNA2_/TRDRNA2_158120_c0_seq1.p1  ORF type:complete len:270 (+),score=31.90 gnl/TRDRNA2_/TRDRNA2_158120_c0_seq1:94-903(+)
MDLRSPSAVDLGAIPGAAMPLLPMHPPCPFPPLPSPRGRPAQALPNATPEWGTAHFGWGSGSTFSSGASYGSNPGSALTGDSTAASYTRESACSGLSTGTVYRYGMPQCNHLIRLIETDRVAIMSGPPRCLEQSRTSSPSSREHPLQHLGKALAAAPKCFSIATPRSWEGEPSMRGARRVSSAGREPLAARRVLSPSKLEGATRKEAEFFEFVPAPRNRHQEAVKDRLRTEQRRDGAASAAKLADVHETIESKKSRLAKNWRHRAVLEL